MQTKAATLRETVLDVGSGILIAWALTRWVMPVWGYSYGSRAAAEITILYTVVSMLRSFLWRRYFASGHGRPQKATEGER